MKQVSNDINRRQAIGFAAACFGGIALGSFNTDERVRKSGNLARQIRALHLQLFLFNQELVPRFIDGRSRAPAYELKRAKRFLGMSLYLRRLLDQRSGGGQVFIDEEKLTAGLKKLYVCASLTCQRLDRSMRECSDFGFLTSQSSVADHSFYSLRFGSTTKFIRQSAVMLCHALKKPTSPHSAAATVRNACEEDLAKALKSMDPIDYLTLLEPLFLIRPTAPVSLLTLHSQQHGKRIWFRGFMSTICGNLMESLANNYFQQTLAIGRLSECDGGWHPFTLGQVFDILMQKWLLLMRGMECFDPTQIDHASALPFALARGVVESMPCATSELPPK